MKITRRLSLGGFLVTACEFVATSGASGVRMVGSTGEGATDTEGETLSEAQGLTSILSMWSLSQQEELGGLSCLSVLRTLCGFPFVRGAPAQA
jgi:hypothetical protein